MSKLRRVFDKREAVKGISFDVHSGEIFGFLGPNGAGKTTTINILCTLLKPTSGEARVAGHDVTREEDAVRQAIGIVFQDPALDERLTALENLRFHAWIYRVPWREIPARIDRALDLVGLLGGVSIALIQGSLVLAAAPLLGIAVPLESLPGIFLIMTLGASAMNLLGLALAARMQSMQGFQMAMSLVSMPMFLLSGAFFPLNDAPSWMRSLAVVNPFTYAVDGLRAAMGQKLALFSFGLDAGVPGTLTVLFLCLTVWVFSQRD